MIALLILLTYIALSLVLSPWLDSFNEYASYITESAFVFAVGFYYRNRLRFSFQLSRELIHSLLPGFIAGFVFSLGLKPLGLIAPFDLESASAILLLILIGPILEEAIFRMALWEPLLDLTRSKPAALVITTVLFAYAHLHAIWFTPPEIHSFIFYQTAYVTVLGGLCGLRKIASSSLSAPILTHITFNTAFYLATLI